MPEKMYPKASSLYGEHGEESATARKIHLHNIRQYTMPILRENQAGCYIEFYAFDPERGKLRRKTIKTNRVKGKLKRRRYAKDVMERLNEKLLSGWNPWIMKDVENLVLFEEGLARYDDYLEKMMADFVPVEGTAIVVFFCKGFALQTEKWLSYPVR